MSEAQRLLQANSMLIEMNQHSTTRLLDAHRDFAALLGDGPSTAFCEGMERRIGELEAELASVVANFTAGRERADCPSPSAQSPGKNATVEEKYERLKAKYHRQLERHTQRERELEDAIEVAQQEANGNWQSLCTLLPFVRSCLRISPEGIVSGDVEIPPTVQGTADSVYGPQLPLELAAADVVSEAMPVIQNGGSLVIFVMGGKGSGRSSFFSGVVGSLKDQFDACGAGARCTFDFAVSDADEYHVVARTVGEIGVLGELLLEKHKYGSSPRVAVSLRRADRTGSAVVVELPVDSSTDIAGLLSLMSCSRESRRRSATTAYESGNPLHKTLFPSLCTRQSFAFVVGVVGRDAESEVSKLTVRTIAKMKQCGNRRVPLESENL